ncbi:MAG TPA: hypothetical protein VFE36_15365, partial [Candidatus Baltobacteraceae bacterium]|nr:hypothetical protein [Candidatus Baltobacteraceae bacterium]
DRHVPVPVNAKEPYGRGKAEVAPRMRSSRDDPGIARALPGITPCAAGGSPARESSGIRVRPAPTIGFLVE